MFLQGKLEFYKNKIIKLENKKLIYSIDRWLATCFNDGNY